MLRKKRAKIKKNRRHSKSRRQLAAKLSRDETGLDNIQPEKGKKLEVFTESRTIDKSSVPEKAVSPRVESSLSQQLASRVADVGDLEAAEDEIPLSGLSPLHQGKILVEKAMEFCREKINLDAALSYFELGMKLKIPDAYCGMAQMHWDGLNFEPNCVKARDYFLEAAELGHGPAYTRVGELYRVGLVGIRRDCARALYYYERAAQLEEDDAVYILAGMSDESSEKFSRFKQNAKFGTQEFCMIYFWDDLISNKPVSSHILPLLQRHCQEIILGRLIYDNTLREDTEFLSAVTYPTHSIAKVLGSEGKTDKAKKHYQELINFSQSILKKLRKSGAKGHRFFDGTPSQKSSGQGVENGFVKSYQRYLKQLEQAKNDRALALQKYEEEQLALKKKIAEQSRVLTDQERNALKEEMRKKFMQFLDDHPIQDDDSDYHNDSDVESDDDVGCCIM